MSTRKIRTPYIEIIVLTLLFATQLFAQNRPYQASDSTVQMLLDRLNSRVVAFRVEMDRSLDRSPINGSSQEDSINTRVADLETSVSQLRNDFSARRSTTAEVQDVFDRAAAVNRSVQNNRVTLTGERLWTQIRTDLDTLAGYYRLRTNWNSTGVYPTTPTTAYGGSPRNTIYQLRQHTSAFQQSFDRWLRFNRNSQSWSSDNISQYVTQFTRALDDLEQNSGRRDSADIQAVLRPAASINSFLVTNRGSYDVTSKWSLVRTDLNNLANYYRVSWDWNNTGETFNDFDTRITGTYRLNENRSDNITTAIDQAMRNVTYESDQRDRITRNLERRLRSPETLTIEKVGQQMTMSSPNGSSVTFQADGVTRTETSPRGRTVRTTVTSTSNTITINYEGDRMNDFYVTFRPSANDQLRVTRRVYLENQNQTVSVSSVYDKVSPTPQWDTLPSTVGGNVNSYVIPNNTGITATLDNSLSTATVRDGDRFTMTVTSPGRYSGAVIEGTAYGQRSGTVAGRANMSLSFDTIRLLDGRTYKFAGIVEQVRQPNGDIVRVNNEGTIRDSSQTNKTVTRAGIGAVLGAIIGAVAGGGQGAAIGAAVGAGAGAGTVILQGRDNLELQSGSQFTITATAPANVAAP